MIAFIETTCLFPRTEFKVNVVWNVAMPFTVSIEFVNLEKTLNHLAKCTEAWHKCLLHDVLPMLFFAFNFRRTLFHVELWFAWQLEGKDP